MGVIQGWVGIVVLAIAAVIAILAWLIARPRPALTTSVRASNLDRVRALPGFRALARREWRIRRIEAVCLLVALAGTALMGARLVGIGDDSQEMRTREVVLCLDVSGSMKEIDADVIDTYLALIETLTEERIGFVMFDAYAVTVFPLTTDHEYIAAQLNEAKESLSASGVPGTSAPNVGSSLIGDGLASCIQHFDQLEVPRSRTIVLATDNLVSGDSIYTVKEAGAIAEDRGIMVFGVMPEATPAAAIEDLRSAAQSTSGDVLTIAAGKPTNIARISSAITSQQKAALLTLAQDRSFDRVWPGAMLLIFGLAGSLAVAWRRP